MGKNKLAKFADMEVFPHVFQVASKEILAGKLFENKGRWNEMFFQHEAPIVLELGCGKGEYTVGLAAMFPEKNFIGVDIKGARMWTGAKDALQKELTNVAFLRTNIEMLHHCFAEGEISEIWLTFPDPQMKKVSKRLTATNFMKIYQQLLKENGIVHLKTDSNFMFTYTQEMVQANHYPILFSTDDLYQSDLQDPILGIKTYYEEQWLERGLSIKYISFLLEHRAVFVEPDVEIEKDDYRSFGRRRPMS